MECAALLHPHLKSKKQTRFENIVIQPVTDRMCIYLRLTVANIYKHIPQIQLVTPTFRPPNDETPIIRRFIIVDAISRDQITDSFRYV